MASCPLRVTYAAMSMIRERQKNKMSLSMSFQNNECVLVCIWCMQLCDGLLKYGEAHA